MYSPGTYPSYSPGTYGTRLMLKVCLSCFSLLLLFLFRIGMRDRWTKIDNGTRSSLGSGRSPKRIGPNTRPNRGMVSIAGFDPPMLCAWSNTGADRDPTKHSAVKPRAVGGCPVM